MQLITWIPVDIAAAAVVEMRTSPAPYLHLLHPKPIAWTSIITPIAKSLDVPVVAYAEWLRRLNKFAEEDNSSKADQVEKARENPALRLLDFYRNAGAPNDAVDGSLDGGTFGRLSFDMDVTKRVVKTLGDPHLPTLGDADAKRWLAYWNEIGVLQVQSS